MATLKNFDQVFRNINRVAIDTIQNQVNKLVQNELTAMLSAQKNAYGESLPEKEESTKKQYRKKGYNTDDWFIRTGKSIQLRDEKLMNGIKIYPVDQDKILQYVGKKKNKPTGYIERYFTLNADIQNKIIETINKELEKIT